MATAGPSGPHCAVASIDVASARISSKTLSATRSIVRQEYRWLVGRYGRRSRVSSPGGAGPVVPVGALTPAGLVAPAAVAAASAHATIATKVTARRAHTKPSARNIDGN